MKSYKTLISVMVVALIAIVATYIVSRSLMTSVDKGSVLLKENIEALSGLEGTQYKMMCTTFIEYSGGYSMPLYCRTCSFHYGYVARGGSSLCP